MPAPFHPTPSILPLLPEAFPPKPLLVAAGEIQSHVSFQKPLPVGFQWPLDSGAIFQLPVLLTLRRERLPVFISYRNAAQLLQIGREKRKRIRLIQLKPVARPFFLIKFLIFNRLEAWFPSHSVFGLFLRKLRNRYE